MDKLINNKTDYLWAMIEQSILLDRRKIFRYIFDKLQLSTKSHIYNKILYIPTDYHNIINYQIPNYEDNNYHSLINNKLKYYNICDMAIYHSNKYCLAYAFNNGCMWTKIE